MPTTGDINNSLNTVIADSLNEVNEDNSVNTDLSAEDSFNETTNETVTNESTVDVDGSFNEDSNNESTVITDSGNDNSDNSDNSVDLDWTEGSYNEYTDASTTDNSVNIGVRDYNTGAWGAGSSAAAAGSGHTEIWSNDTVIDQSANQLIASEGSVTQVFGNSAVAASGEGSIAAGGDVDWSYDVDQSTNIDAGGDINIGNETTVTTVVDSYNEYNLDYSYTDESTVIDVSDSFNDFSENYSADGSFNTSEVFDSETTIDIDYTEVVDSFNTADLNLPLA
ncbi:hypothetical protein DBR36_09455 [Microbacterium sp. HMWF026]|uniref:hypothetical protein n=1 Tax=Microbacterium sp. HMWF026 TaxID=2056861 RepID=UPI000D340D08|nr:hypothetical protein [Microbacterium sp. HMWF026]PTT18376.1 hypothetical protein DBR36_09455 [Microbacterium sp. HMWF026]